MSLVLLVPSWPAPKHVRAVFTERSGGASRPPFDSLNLGAHTRDAPDAVAENRRRLREHLALPSEPVWLNQVHGAQVLDLDAGGESSVVPSADAAFTRRGGRVAAVLVADCLAVLITDRLGRVAAVAHAGWRGLAGGVLRATVERLEQAPQELMAWLSPGIGPAHFEVGEDVRTAMLALDGGLAAAFTPNARGRWQCDLAAIARAQLASLGIGAVHGRPPCTYAERERFFSYRRDGQCGRMAALIWLEL